MIKLGSREPVWLDLAEAVRIKVRPITTPAYAMIQAQAEKVFDDWAEHRAQAEGLDPANQSVRRGLMRDDPRHRFNLAGVASSGNGVTVVVQPTVTNSVPEARPRVETGRGPAGEILIDVFVEQMEMMMSRKIGRGEGLAPTLERRYGLNPAAGTY